MNNYRNNLPQLSGDLFLTDAGVETNLIFNHGIKIREFAADKRELRESNEDAIAFIAELREVLDDGNPVELANQYKAITNAMPWVNVFGGGCGSDLRHIVEIAKAVGGKLTS